MAKRPQRTRKAELIETLGKLFRADHNQVYAVDRAAAERLGINLTDLHCIDVVERLGGITAGELARELGLTTGAVTAVVDRLEKVGYLERDRDPGDRRRVIVRLTDLARKRAGEVYGPPAQEWHSYMDSFTEADLAVVASYMEGALEIGRRHLERLRADEG